MHRKIKNGFAISLLPQIVLVKWIGSYPEIIEHYYSNGIYLIISKFLRLLFGWIPFSIGDLIYIILIIITLRYLLKNRKEIKKNFSSFLRDIATVLSIVYFVFHLFWGLNYYRTPIGQALNLKESHENDELVFFTKQLIHKANEIHLTITKDSNEIVHIPYSKKEIFSKTRTAYQNLEYEFPIFAYQYSSLKKSLLSIPLTYMGYGGYLNPFTHEAQVNSKLPLVRFPIVSGHEVGHQVGYSAENETNFIGFLATIHLDDPYFKYSGYTYALSYCLSDIRKKDEVLFNELYAQVNVGIKKNYQEIALFWEQYENPTEPIFKAVFSSFLKANSQSQGIQSYNAVVSLLVTYHQKYPL